MGIGELARRLSERVPLSVGASRRAVVAIIDLLYESVSGGEEVRLKGLGRFTDKRVSVKRLKHPGTGEELIIPEHRKPVFRFTDEVSYEVRRRTETKAEDRKEETE